MKSLARKGPFDKLLEFDQVSVCTCVHVYDVFV